MKFEYVGFIALGLLLGIVLGLVIYNLGLFSLAESNYLLYTISGVLSIIFAIIAYFYKK